MFHELEKVPCDNHCHPTLASNCHGIVVLRLYPMGHGRWDAERTSG